MKIIQLTEYQPLLIPRNNITISVIDQLQEKYSSQIEVNLKYQKGDFWQFTSQGWVGHIPLTPEFHIALHPKVPLANLFGMLEYAYNLKSFRFLEGLINCQSLEEFYSQLALILAKRILNRCRQGIYRTYVQKTNQLAYVRGRMDLQRTIQKPWKTKLSCNYEEYTSDIEDNQILVWTLRCIIRCGICHEQALSAVRKAYRTLQGLVTLQPFRPSNCMGRQYNRLNEDYQLLHAICHFFLENTAPSHQLGNQTTLPFLVNMARLYELFVAEWLKVNLPQSLFLKYQERINIGSSVQFKTDIVLYESGTMTPRYILDTKYKNPDSPAKNDISQVLTYALSKHCDEAILVYPAQLTRSLDERIGGIRVRSLTFSLSEELNQAGRTFLQTLLE